MISKIHSRMHPNALCIKFSRESIPSNPLAIKLNSVIRTARQSKDVLQFLPIISKLAPMFEHGFLPLIIHSGTPPPPPITMGCATIMPC